MNDEAKNLQAICAAMDSHARTCGEPLIEVRMSPYEVDRLDWEEIRGVPIKADPFIGTGKFRLVCSGIHGDGDAGAASAVVTEPAVVEEREPLYARAA